jgi:hypothetical protein
LPPDSFFDAIIDVRATLSANVAALVGKQMYKELFDRWRAAMKRHATPDGRLPLGAIAFFLVDDMPALLSGMHMFTTLSLDFQKNAFQFIWETPAGRLVIQSITWFFVVWQATNQKLDLLASRGSEIGFADSAYLGDSAVSIPRYRYTEQ